jgi:hypothetical protein
MASIGASVDASTHPPSTKTLIEFATSLIGSLSRFLSAILSSVSTGRRRHGHWLDATHDKSKLATIIGNITAILLHSVLKEIHECTEVEQRESSTAHLGDAMAAYRAARPPA